MTKIKKTIIFILILTMVLGVLAGCAPKEPQIVDIEISKNPTKTEYYVGEEFSPAGGEIKLIYDDESTETMSMTAEGVSISSVNTTISAGEMPDNGHSNRWTRTVMVRYGEDASASFPVYVSHQEFVVTYDYGYGDKVETVKEKKGFKVAEPTAPTRPGNYRFDAWYTAYDSDGKRDKYDFSTLVSGDLTLYANWIDTSVQNHKVTFDLDYYGAKKQKETREVADGAKAEPITDPIRDDYRFDGWFTQSNGGTKFDFNSAITGDITLYAHWTKTKTGESTYVFEAECINLDGVEGPGLSGRGSGSGMIVTADDVGASGHKFLSYLYESGVQLDFQLAVDETIRDATVTLRLSAEARSFIMSSSNYKVIINSTELGYDAIEFKNVPPINFDKTDCLDFEDFVIGTNVYLPKGSNTITLLTDNDNPLEQTTILAYAPLVDCLKITTTGVVTWAYNLGLPMAY